MLSTLTGEQWTPLLKPWPVKPAVDGGFTLDDFIPDTAAGTLTCPAGVTRGVTAKRTGLNLRRLLALGLTVENGTWALA
jgi:hypothetical protein